MKLDVLVFSTHPDDAELFCGGTIARLVHQGYRVGIVDLTHGELSTRGTRELRMQEALAAADVLGIHVRENAGLPDGNIENNRANQMVLINFIRRFQPKLVFAPFDQDRHPDHVHASKLVTESCFYAGLPKIKTEDPAFRPRQIIYYFSHYLEQPTFVVDVSEFFQTKLLALQAYASQFYNGQTSEEPETFISGKTFWEGIKARARFYGHMIEAEYGEPFFYRSVLKINNIYEFFA